MSLGNQRIIFHELYQSVEQIPCPPGQLQPSRQAYSQSQTLPDDSLVDALRSLTKHFYLARKLDPIYAATLANVLAEATKQQPLWRTLFGLSTQHHDVEYESILHVALGIKHFDYHEHRSLLKDCLRLIANCCADNNANRKFCLDHGVMGDLIDLAMHEIELDILIPTLYNVCIDYEDSVEAANLAVGDDEQIPNESIQSINLASRKLFEVSRDGCASFQVLLSLGPACSEDRRPYLAELVEMACSPISQGLKPVTEDVRSSNTWRFELHGREQQTIDIAGDLASGSEECHLHVLRAVLSLLSNERLRKDFLAHSRDKNIWKLVTMASSLIDETSIDLDELEEETVEGQKQFLKMFYELTGMPAFVTQDQSTDNLITKCIETLSSLADDGKKLGSRNQKTCSLIILAQLAACEPLRQRLQADQSLLDILSHVLQVEDNNDILYPAVTLTSRLCRTDETDLVLVQDRFLQPMVRLMNGKGRGLIIPFEVVSTYKLMIRNRPHYLKDLMKTKNSESSGSVIHGIFALFDTTIEAGTKLEVGHFVLEVLRTMFGQSKDLDAQLSPVDPPTWVFRSLLESFANKIGEVLAFVCSQAEPKEQRVHGWFGLGMFSVWKQGRSAIAKAIDQSDFAGCLLDIAKVRDGPAAQNAKLMLSKMQLCCKQDLTASTITTLEEAAKSLGFEFTPAAS